MKITDNAIRTAKTSDLIGYLAHPDQLIEVLTDPNYTLTSDDLGMALMGIAAEVDRRIPVPEDSK